MAIEQRRICKQEEKQKQNFVVRQNLLNQSASVVLIIRWETSTMRSQLSWCGLHFVGPTPHRIVGQAPIAGDTGWFGPIDASGGRSGQQARIET